MLKDIPGFKAAPILNAYKSIFLLQKSKEKLACPLDFWELGEKLNWCISNSSC